jgi:hypothetical protein
MASIWEMIDMDTFYRGGSMSPDEYDLYRSEYSRLYQDLINACPKGCILGEKFKAVENLFFGKIEKRESIEDLKKVVDDYKESFDEKPERRRLGLDF